MARRALATEAVSRLVVGLMALAIGVLGGCATEPERPSEPVDPEPVEMEPVAPQFRPTPGIGDRERYLYALELLNDGNADQARAELQYLADTGAADRRVRLLLDSVNRSPSELFAERVGPGSFGYEIQRGESLSQISQVFLGESMLFYALAQYNDIAVPGQVQAQTKIRVPGERPEVMPDRPTRTEVEQALDEGVGEAIASQVRANREAAEAQDGLARPPEPAGEDAAGGAPATPSVEQRIAELVAAADVAADPQAARDALESAQALAPGDPAIAASLAELALEQAEAALAVQAFGRAQAHLDRAGDQLTRVERADLVERSNALGQRLQAGRAYEEGIAAREAGDPVTAYARLAAAATLDPGLDVAVQARDAVASEAVDTLHQEALDAFSTRTLDGLDESIELWGQVLEIDPANEQAQLKRQQAMFLRSQLRGGG